MTEQYYKAAKWLMALPQWKKEIVEKYYLTSKHSKSVAEIEAWLKKFS